MVWWVQPVFAVAQMPQVLAAPPSEVISLLVMVVAVRQGSISRAAMAAAEFFQAAVFRAADAEPAAPVSSESRSVLAARESRLQAQNDWRRYHVRFHFRYSRPATNPSLVRGYSTGLLVSTSAARLFGQALPECEVAARLPGEVRDSKCEV